MDFMPEEQLDLKVGMTLRPRGAVFSAAGIDIPTAVGPRCPLDIRDLTRTKPGQQSSLRLLHVIKKSGTVGYLLGLSKWYESMWQ
jgi:hypothetical protein